MNIKFSKAVCFSKENLNTKVYENASFVIFAVIFSKPRKVTIEMGNEKQMVSVMGLHIQKNKNHNTAIFKITKKKVE